MVNASKQWVRLPAGHGLDVVVDPEVVVAERLGLPRRARRVRFHASAAVQPVYSSFQPCGTNAPWPERSPPVAHANSQYCTSTIIGSR